MSEQTDNDIESCHDTTNPFVEFLGLEHCPLRINKEQQEEIKREIEELYEDFVKSYSEIIDLLSYIMKMTTIQRLPLIIFRFIRIFLLLGLIIGSIITAVLIHKEEVTFQEDFVTVLFFIIPFYFTYIFSTWDKFFRKIEVVESNIKDINNFINNLNLVKEFGEAINTNITVIHKRTLLEANDFVMKVMVKLAVQLDEYKREMSPIGVLFKIIFAEPPKYHQYLEENNFLEDKINYYLEKKHAETKRKIPEGHLHK